MMLDLASKVVEYYGGKKLFSRFGWLKIAALRGTFSQIFSRSTKSFCHRFCSLRKFVNLYFWSVVVKREFGCKCTASYDVSDADKRLCMVIMRVNRSKLVWFGLKIHWLTWHVCHSWKLFFNFSLYSQCFLCLAFKLIWYGVPTLLYSVLLYYFICLKSITFHFSFHAFCSWNEQIYPSQL